MQLGIDLFKNERNSMNRKVVIHVFIYIDMHVSEAHYGGGGVTLGKKMYYFKNTFWIIFKIFFLWFHLAFW